MTPASVVSRQRWHGFEAMVLEDNSARVVVIPELGGKIGSLFDKRIDHEWLVQPTRMPRLHEYGSDYADHDMNSWDEMLPTINECRYPIPGSQFGTQLPDHGDVWTSRWEILPSKGAAIAVAAESRALPLRIRREVSWVSPAKFVITYEVSCAADEPIAFLWAAHPLLAADTNSVLVLPESVTEVVNVHESVDWGRPGAVLPYPLAQAQSGKLADLRKVGDHSRRDCRKFYVPSSMRVGWAGLDQSDLNASLRLRWNPELIPHLGIWIDEGTYLNQSAVALEPSSGYYDGLDIAFRNGMFSSSAPNEPVRWAIEAELISRVG